VQAIKTIITAWTDLYIKLLGASTILAFFLILFSLFHLYFLLQACLIQVRMLLTFSD
jgi:hypothetical protein